MIKKMGEIHTNTCPKCISSCISSYEKAIYLSAWFYLPSRQKCWEAEEITPTKNIEKTTTFNLKQQQPTRGCN